MRVVGTVEIRFEVNIDVEDISEDAMEIDESDELIKKAIEKKYDVTTTSNGVFVEKYR